MLALALRGCSSYFTPVRCLKGLSSKREADSMNGEGCFKNLLWAICERQKVSTSSLSIRVAMIDMGAFSGRFRRHLTPRDYTTITHSVVCFKPKKFDFVHQTVSPLGGCGLSTRLFSPPAFIACSSTASDKCWGEKAWE